MAGLKDPTGQEGAAERPAMKKVEIWKNVTTVTQLVWASAQRRGLDGSSDRPVAHDPSISQRTTASPRVMRAATMTSREQDEP
jgi:hypothetical protein